MEGHRAASRGYTGRRNEDHCRRISALEPRSPARVPSSFVSYSISYVDLIRDDYMRRHDLNCAEAMLHAGNEAYELGLSKEALKVTAGFGGGLGTEHLCGAASGAVMLLGVLFAEERGHTSAKLAALRDEFVQRFTERFGKLDCAHVKAHHRSLYSGCQPVVEGAAEIVDDIVGRELGPQP